MKNDLPIQKLERISLVISGLTHTGEGVGRYRGVAVFVPGTMPGDTVLAEVVDVKKNYARGRLLEITEHAPGRCEPECRHTAGCGGCRFQHVDYTLQLKLKTGLVRDSLNRIAGLNEVRVRETIGMTHPWHYRNKVHYQVQKGPDGFELGFYQEGSHNLAAFFEEGCLSNAGCLLVDKELNHVAATIKKLLNKYGTPASNEATENIVFRNVVLRKAVSQGEIMAVMVTTGQDWPAEKAFVAELLSSHKTIASVIRNINEGPQGLILGKENRILAGRRYIIDRLGHLAFRISPDSFYQVNPAQALVLYQKAMEYSDLGNHRAQIVLDAYSGVGTIALFLAREAGKVYGLEAVPGAVEDARRNAVLNKIDNVEFHAGKVEQLLPVLAGQGLRVDVVVLDPPRRGCEQKALEAVTEMAAGRVVYVSCDPGTLARDLGYLVKKGYRVDEVQPVDMFPWTHHVECIVLITRAEKPMK